VFRNKARARRLAALGNKNKQKRAVGGWMSFWAELKRRNVVRVGAIYLAAAWLLAQIGDVVSQAFAAPGWPMRVLLVLLALGLPIVLVIAWLFELTPEGVKLTREVDVETSITHATGRRLDRVLIGMIALLIVVLVANRWWPSSTAPKPAESAAAQAASAGAATPASSAQSEKSVAVLPFVNLSSDPEQEYFSDGLSEEILNQLAQIAELRVTARTSSFFFKGKNEDLRVIGQQLNARYLLEGSVRKAGNELRITAQLIDALAGSHLWSRTFDRTLNDVFAIQEEIAMAVSGAMSVSLDVGAMARTRGGTTNLEAYDKYLRARAFDRQRGTSDDLVQAAQYYREALALDPAFIRAASDLYLELASWLHLRARPRRGKSPGDGDDIGALAAARPGKPIHNDDRRQSAARGAPVARRRAGDRGRHGRRRQFPTRHHERGHDRSVEHRARTRVYAAGPPKTGNGPVVAERLVRLADHAHARGPHGRRRGRVRAQPVT